MAVHFVFRRHGNGPTWRSQRRWDDATLVDWFRRNWHGSEDEDEARNRARDLLGADVYSFHNVFLAIARSSLPPPTNIEGLLAVLGAAHHIESFFEEHCLQVLTRDSHDDTAYYFCDDEFLARHGALAAYLLREDWRLPDGAGPGGWRPQQLTVPAAEVPIPTGGGAGWIYSASVIDEGSANLRNLLPEYAEHIAGLRVPDLCRALLQLSEAEAETAIRYCSQLHKALRTADLVASDEEWAFVCGLREDPGDELTWRVYADWLMERGERPPGQRLLEQAFVWVNGASPASRNLVQVGEHVVQFFGHEGDERFNHWVLFDDLWGSAHPDLAAAILRYATRWNVLSPDGITGTQQ